MFFNFSEYRPRRIIRRHHQGIMPADILRQNRVRLSIRRIIVDFYLSGVNGRQANIITHLEELRSLIWFIINVSNHGNALNLHSNVRQKYRDYERNYYTGKLAEAISWTYFRSQHNARYFSDTRFYLQRRRLFPGRQSLSDFCFISGNVLNIFEVKGTWPLVSTDGVKSKIIKAHTQNLATRNYFNNNNIPIGKSHICSVSCSSSNLPWNSEIHYVDPTYSVHRELSFEEKKEIEKIYYSGWFKWVGLNRVAQSILDGVEKDYDLNLEIIIQNSEVQKYNGRSFFIFHTKESETPLSLSMKLVGQEVGNNIILEHLMDYSELRFGISTEAVKYILNPKKLLPDIESNSEDDSDDSEFEICIDQTIIVGTVKNRPYEKKKLPKMVPSPQAMKEEFTI